MARPAGSRNIAGKVRATFMRLTEARDGNDPKFDFEAALLNSLNTNFLDTMKMMKNYIPTEMLFMPDAGEDGEQGELAQIFRLQVVAPDGSIIHESAEPGQESEPIEGEYQQIPTIPVETVKPGEANADVERRRHEAS